MYKPSNRMISKGLIPNRQPYFNERAYEYTFAGPDNDTLMQVLSAALDAKKHKNVSYKVYTDRPVVVIIGFSWKLEFYRSAHLDNNVSYTAFFSRWEAYGNTLSSGDYMNQTLTILEEVLLSFDPLVWVRELYDHPHVTNGIMSSPEIWAADVPDRKMTREEAAAKRLSEYFLADRLREYGWQVYGGTPFAQSVNAQVNPLITKRLEDEAERIARQKEEAENPKPPEEPPKKYCASCGAELAANARFCTKCGTPVKLTVEEKKAQEKTLKSFPPFFIVSAGEPLEPYIHSRIDDELEIIEEPADHGFAHLTLSGIEVYRKAKGDEKYKAFYSNSMKGDNELYVSDSRLVFINRKYNKDEAGSWMGIGGITAMAIAGALTAAERGIKASQRKGKALTGHIRYEWIAYIYFHHKAKTFDHEKIRIIYSDIERTWWNVNFILTGSDDAEELANFILQRACTVRYSMTDKKDDDLKEFLEKYRTGANRIPIDPDPGKMSGAAFPVFYYATKGMPYLPD